MGSKYDQAAALTLTGQCLPLFSFDFSRPGCTVTHMNSLRRFRRDSDPMANAMRLLDERSIFSSTFQNAKAATIAEIVAMPLSEDKLRELGGWSKLISDTMEKHCAGALSAGSQLIPGGPLFKLLKADDVRGVIQAAKSRNGTFT